MEPFTGIPTPTVHLTCLRDWAGAEPAGQASTSGPELAPACAEEHEHVTRYKRERTSETAQKAAAGCQRA